MRKVNYDANGKVYLTTVEEAKTPTTWNGNVNKLPKYRPGFKSFVNGKEVQ